MGKRDWLPVVRDALEQLAAIALASVVTWLLLATLQAQVGL